MRLLIFFLLNFGALALGGFLAGNPADNDWYEGLNKAPFTPPGWVFGFAWTTIMIFFSLFMFHITGYNKKSKVKTFFIVYSFQWILNVLWNPTFFRFHEAILAEVILLLLTFTVTYFLALVWKERNLLNLILILPYFLWLLVANGLNIYIILYN